MNEKTKTICETIGKVFGNIAVMCIDAWLIVIVFNFFAYNFNFATMPYGIAFALRFLNPFTMFSTRKNQDKNTMPDIHIHDHKKGE